MLLLLADENMKRQVVRGLMRRGGNVDIVTVQDVGLAGVGDHSILEWAANAGRVVITYDVATMPDAAYERAAKGLDMPGVFAVPWHVPVGQVIEDLALLAEASEPEE